MCGGVYEFVHFRFAHHQRRRRFQDHEIVTANLRQDITVLKQSHDEYLPE